MKPAPLKGKVYSNIHGGHSADVKDIRSAVEFAIEDFEAIAGSCYHITIQDAKRILKEAFEDVMK